jgi:hypothetical protein
MGKRLRIPVALGLGLFAALAAATAFSNPSVSFRSAERDGGRVAEVLIGEQVVIVLRTWAGGYSPVERAEIVANRLREAMAASMEMYAEDVEVGPVPSGQGVFLTERLVVAVYPSEAEAHGATSEALAAVWRDNIIRALALGTPVVEPGQDVMPGEQEVPVTEAEAETVVEEEVAAAEAPVETVDWTGAAQKWVPIFSLSGEGVSAGFAQVAGPTQQVDKVKAVAELRLSFQSVGRIYAYIPVSAISTKPQRVQGVSVWAIADVKLVNF